MATLLNSAIDSYNSLFIDRRDPRVDGWLLMGSPFPTLAICITYVYLVKVLGPRYMAERPAFNFRRILVAYNAFQVVFSAWIFYELGMGGWFGHYSLRCQPVDYSNDPMSVRFAMGGWLRGYSFRCQPVDYSNDEMAVRMTHASWWYYFSKFTEFFDTFFFVLRKKFEHVSALHVVHHGCMPMSVWFGVKFTPGGHSTFFGLLNSFVHIVMYFYYMLAAMGPQYSKYLWWKKHLTTLQMIQFVGIFSHAFQLCFRECDYPRGFMWWIGGHAVLFFFLFTKFYLKAYKNRQPKNRQLANNNSNFASLTESLIPCMIHEKNGYANGHIPHNKERENEKIISNGYAKMNGHVANGYVGKRNGHVEKGNGHVEHALNGNGHAVNGNGHAVNSNGHAVNSNGHVGNSNGHVVNGNGHVDHITNGFITKNLDHTRRRKQ